ncbi:MAG: Rne/Rng family ribonuclease [Candidatus Nanopelagicaceae bacterium]|nr:Rne/Rng family ribonuclease [Candidatus Nanopelagicaceae bacterium]
MADEPKAPRKRASKKAAEVDSTSEAPAEKKTRKKAVPAVVATPIFQAAPVEAVKPAKKEKPAKSGSKKDNKEEQKEKLAKQEEDSDSRRGGRRRRRGGRGRRKGGEENSTGAELASTDESSEDSATSHRRRRRRRGAEDGVQPGEIVDEDGVPTVVKVRESKERPERTDRSERSDRHDRNSRRDRHHRREGRHREDRREYRETYRRRGTIITEGEFLARRDEVKREMLVRQKGDRTQICVIEDGVMVEHYVNRNSSISYVGNVYLGKVQNVLPSMEAAFVDIGKGRNAVLYAGEVNWDAAGLEESAPRKIETALKTGQPVLVQVTKDPIGQKGARLTSQISLPGRYVVYVPGGGMSGISRRLPEPERNRIKNILKGLVPEEAGVIVRTAAEGVSEEELTGDIQRLKAQWDEIYQKTQNPNFHPPVALYTEPDLAVRVIRDIFSEDFEILKVQGDQVHREISDYLGFIAPELSNKIEKYTGTGDLFSDYRVDEQLAKAFDRKVYLPSGGSLVIDRTEAMVVIDVNTGKFIGKGGNLEETVTKNNLEAAEEIARQLRLRDLGGIVVIDFIDMILESNREAVMRRLVECLGRDRTKHQVAEVTSLGLVQLTRKRIGQGLIEAFSTTCDSCNGRGIHIHTEPVRAKAAAPVFAGLNEDSSDDHSEHDDSDESNNEANTHRNQPAEARGTKPRKRRRAVSTGVVTPGK